MSYVVTPSNYDACVDYIQEYCTEVQKKIITSSRVYVLDACAIQRYMHSNRADYFAQYVSYNNGCVIIFRTILMELSGDRACLEEEQINFIKTLHLKDIDVFLLFEEDLKELLQVYTDNGRINNFLRYAVQCVNGQTGAVHDFLDNHDRIRNELFNNSSDLSPDFYKLFWTEFRSTKKHGDNLGEYACAICIHIMAEMEDNNMYKYIFITEDKPAIGILSRVIRNIRINNGKDLIGCATSARIAERMYTCGIIADAKGIKDFLKPVPDARIKANVIDSYAVEPEARNFTIEEFAEYICNGKGKIIA